jgi:hypothetical protein
VGAERKQALDVWADAHDLASSFEARHIGCLWATFVSAMGLHDVSEVDPGGAHTD